jgi:hypothetical protein
MKELSQILCNATAAIEGGYFHLKIDGGQPVYRERVYCYELYHQMRVLWPPECQFSLNLNGEVDKIAHPILENRGIYSKPDFLVHVPGCMSGNYAIIEVKNAETDDRVLAGSFGKLTTNVQCISSLALARTSAS